MHETIYLVRSFTKTDLIYIALGAALTVIGVIGFIVLKLSEREKNKK